MILKNTYTKIYHKDIDDVIRLYLTTSYLERFDIIGFAKICTIQKLNI